MGLHEQPIACELEDRFKKLACAGNFATLPVYVSDINFAINAIIRNKWAIMESEAYIRYLARKTLIDCSSVKVLMHMFAEGVY